MLLAILFGEIFFGPVFPTALTELFEKFFPSVWAFIVEEKRAGYEELARNMQRAESAFFIDTVCRRLMDHHRDVPLVTINDSIVTTVAPRKPR